MCLGTYQESAERAPGVVGCPELATAAPWLRSDSHRRPPPLPWGAGMERKGGMPAAAGPDIPEGWLMIEMGVKALGFGYARPTGFGLHLSAKIRQIA